MCRTLAHGGARCARAVPLPGAPASSPERAVIRAEAVAEQARATFSVEADAALDALFTRVTEAATPAERTAAVRTWLDSLSGVWHVVVRAIERAHERRIEAIDARWRDRISRELSEVQAARREEEQAALDRLHAMELVLAEVELLSRVDWSDDLWRACQEADLETLASELAAERMRLHQLENRQSRRPDPRVNSELRRGKARTECWRITLEKQRATLATTPRTRAEADQRCAAARADVEAARAAFEAMRGTASQLTDDEHYLAHPVLAAVVEHSRTHPEQRRSRPVRT